MRSKKNGWDIRHPVKSAIFDITENLLFIFATISLDGRMNA
jgi:hypothetical protein